MSCREQRADGRAGTVRERASGDRRPIRRRHCQPSPRQRRTGRACGGNPASLPARQRQRQCHVESHRCHRVRHRGLLRWRLGEVRHALCNSLGRDAIGRRVAGDDEGLLRTHLRRRSKWRGAHNGSHGSPCFVALLPASSSNQPASGGRIRHSQGCCRAGAVRARLGSGGRSAD